MAFYNIRDPPDLGHGHEQRLIDSLGLDSCTYRTQNPVITPLLQCGERLRPSPAPEFHPKRKSQRRRMSAVQRKSILDVPADSIFPPCKGYSFFQNIEEHPFRPTATQFDVRNAWILAELSMLAYAEDEFIVDHLQALTPFSIVAFFHNEEHNSKCFICRWGNAFVIVFRGTEVTSIENIRNDLKMYASSEVHSAELRQPSTPKSTAHPPATTPTSAHPQQKPPLSVGIGGASIDHSVAEHCRQTTDEMMDMTAATSNEVTGMDSPSLADRYRQFVSNFPQLGSPFWRKPSANSSGSTTPSKTKQKSSPSAEEPEDSVIETAENGTPSHQRKWKSVHVHAGFQAATDALWKGERLCDFLVDLLRGGDSEMRLFITGHSLGAAIGTLTAYRLGYALECEPEVLARIAAVYTFGSPKVGTGSFREQYILNDRTYRLATSTDFATGFPPLYTHVGQFKHLNTEGRLCHEHEMEPMRFFFYQVSQKVKDYVQHGMNWWKLWRDLLKDGHNHSPLTDPMTTGVVGHSPLLYCVLTWNHYVDTNGCEDRLVQSYSVVEEPNPEIEVQETCRALL